MLPGGCEEANGWFNSEMLKISVSDRPVLLISKFNLYEQYIFLFLYFLILYMNNSTNLQESSNCDSNSGKCNRIRQNIYCLFSLSMRIELLTR